MLGSMQKEYHTIQHFRLIKRPQSGNLKQQLFSADLS